jgi:hypothetical protein
MIYEIFIKKINNTVNKKIYNVIVLIPDSVIEYQFYHSSKSN